MIKVPFSTKYIVTHRVYLLYNNVRVPAYKPQVWDGPGGSYYHSAHTGALTAWENH
jgi:hypothetical protein